MSTIFSFPKWRITCISYTVENMKRCNTVRPETKTTLQQALNCLLLKKKRKKMHRSDVAEYSSQRKTVYPQTRTKIISMEA